MCNYCTQRAAIPACNNYRLLNVLENRGTSLSVHDNFGTYTFGTCFFGTAGFGILNVNIGTVTFGTYEISVFTRQ